MSLLTHPAQAGQLNRYCAWALLVVSVLTLLWSMAQLGGALALEAYGVHAWLDSHSLVAPGLLGWLMTHAVSVSVLQLLSCLPCVAIGVGLLGTRNWARQGFIAVLLITAVLNLAMLPLMDRLLMDLIGMILAQPGEVSNMAALEQAQADLGRTRAMLWLSSLLPLLALSVIHVWLARRYRRDDMRRLFG